MDQKPLSAESAHPPLNLLQELVGVFSQKGWLNHTLHIMHRDRRYRVFCSETEFIVHRINDICTAPWGFPCWAVCMVTRDRIIEDDDLSKFSSTEPSALDWFHCLVREDFQFL